MIVLCTFLPRIIELFCNKRKTQSEDHYSDHAGKQILSEGLVPGKIEQFLAARKNTTNYVAFIYRFAPVLVSDHI